MSTKKAAIENAEKVIELFGGIRPMASKINVPVTTVQGWKKRNVIPGTRRADIESAAAELNIDLSDVVSVAASSNSVANQNVKKKTQSKQKPKRDSSKKDIVEGNIFVETDKEKEISNVSNSSETTTSSISAKRTSSNEDFLKSIEEENKRTVIKTIWIVTGLVLLTAALLLFFLLPDTNKLNQKIEEQEQALQNLQNDVEQSEKQNSLIKSIVPDDLKRSIDELKEKAQNDLETIQNQARNTQIALEQISKRTSEVSNDVLGTNAGPLSKRLNVIEEQLATLSDGQSNGKFASLIDRIQNLEQSIAGQTQMQDSLSELKNIVGGIDGKVTTLEGELEQAQGSDSALGQTLEGVSGNDLKAAAMLIAFSQLRDSLNREAPFEDDLVLLNKMVGDDNVELKASLDKLAPHADKGILTSAGLSKEFKGLAGDIVVSSLKGEDISIKDKAMARLNDIVKVEKDGELLTGTDTQSAVNKAQAMLDNGDVEGAISVLQTLEGDAAQTAQPFIDQANASILANKVQQMLRNSILSKVSGPVGDIMNSIPTNMLGAEVDSETNLNNKANENSSTSGFDVNAVTKTIENVVTPKEVIKDEESGLSILPRQQGFKGFSTGQ